MASLSALLRALVPATLLAAGLAACASPGGEHDRLMVERGVAGASRQSFILCHGHGCRLRTQLGFTEAEWRPVAELFAAPAADAAAERERIAVAIGLLEAVTGRKAGTSRDVGGTLNAFGVSSGGKTGFDDQFDCFDETTNTSVYLSLLAQAGYMRWHRIKGWAGRGSLIGGGGWPHQSAVIAEVAGGRAYAVDSWFEDNGRPAHIVPLEAWYAEWVPPGFVDTPF